MADRGAVQERLLRQRAGVLKLERLDQALLDRGVPGAFRDLLDHSADEREAGVAVRPCCSERMVLRGLLERRCVLLETVVASTGVGEDVAVDAARVREQVTHRHRLGNLGLREPQFGHHVPDRSVEIELALVDELHGDGRRPHLRHRADLEDRVRSRLDAGLLVQQSRGELDALVVAPGPYAHDPERGARDAVARSQLVEALLPVLGIDRWTFAGRVLFDPVDDAAAHVRPVRRASFDHEQMRSIGVEDEAGRDAALAQGGVPLLSLPDRAAYVGGAVVDERRRVDGVDTRQRRHLLVSVASVPPQLAELELAQVVAHVGGAGHADEIADDPAGDRRREPIVAARQVAGHEAAVAVAGDGQPLRVGNPLGDELVDRLEEVFRVGLAPGADAARVEVGAVPVAPPGVEEQHRPAASRELLVVEVPVVGCTVPCVVRPAVDVEQKRRGRGDVGIADEPPMHDGAV